MTNVGIFYRLLGDRSSSSGYLWKLTEWGSMSLLLLDIFLTAGNRHFGGANNVAAEGALGLVLFECAHVREM